MRINQNGGMFTNNRINNRENRLARILQSRLDEQRREMEIQAREREIIARIGDEINQVRNDGEMSMELRISTIESLQSRIESIYENRAARQELAAEREAMRQQQKLDEVTTMETNARRNNDPISALTDIAVAVDNIGNLQQSRAALQSEAGHIRRAVDSPNSNYTKIGTVGTPHAPSEVAMVINTQAGRGNPQDFRNQHLNRLNAAISRTEAAITGHIAQIYKESAQMQREGLDEVGDNHDDYRPE